MGKSPLACALGHALVDAGRSVLFTPTYQLVQQLLVARRDLCLPRALRALDVFDAVILDDLGYVQQTAEEAEVLFTLMAERYERRSLIITSNQAEHSERHEGLDPQHRAGRLGGGAPGAGTLAACEVRRTAA